MRAHDPDCDLATPAADCCGWPWATWSCADGLAMTRTPTGRRLEAVLIASFTRGRERQALLYSNDYCAANGYESLLLDEAFHCASGLALAWNRHRDLLDSQAVISLPRHDSSMLQATPKMRRTKALFSSSGAVSALLFISDTT